MKLKIACGTIPIGTWESMLEELQEDLEDLGIRLELVECKEDSANLVEALVTGKVSALVFAPIA